MYYRMAHDSKYSVSQRNYNKKVTGLYMKRTVIKTAQLIYQFYCSRFLVSKTKAGKRSVI